MALRLSLGQATWSAQPPNSDRGAATFPESQRLRSHGAVFLVSDAAGKDPRAGAFAEFLVRGATTAWYASPETWSPRRRMEKIFEDLNTTARQEHERMVATLTMVVLVGRTLHLAHVGDSRAWLVRKGQARLLTEDHAWDHPDLRSALHRAMGLDRSVVADFLSLELAVGDLVLLATDGVHKELDPAAVFDERGDDLDESCRAVLEGIKRAKGRDDATLVACRVEELPSEAESQQPLVDIPLEPFPTPREGLEVDGFRLVGRLAKGRCSEVWVADDRIGERKVVLKIPDPVLARDPQAVEEFLREEWIGRRVRHPSLVGVLPLEPLRRTCLYLAMPWIQGKSLRRILDQEGPLDPFKARQVFLDLYPALLALHRQGVLHRDVKPDNVLRDPSGRFLLTDLGVAGVESQGTGGSTPGTPSYMAPELFEGASADERTEVFALGVMLYECLTRRLPYGEIQPFTRPRFSVAPPPSRWNPEIPSWLDHALLRCIQVDADHRFQVLSEVAVAMEQERDVGSPGGSPKIKDEGRARRFLVLWAIASTLVALLEAVWILSRTTIDK